MTGRLSFFDHSSRASLILGFVALSFLFGLYVGYSVRMIFRPNSDLHIGNGVHGRFGHLADSLDALH